MGEPGNYLVQSSVCAASFYVVYYLFLRRLTFFKLNRFYLLASLLLSLSIPFLNIDIAITREAGISQFIPSWYIHQSPADPSHSVLTDHTSQFNWNILIAIIYTTGLLFVLIKLVLSLLIIRKAHNGRLVERSGNARIIEGAGKIGNCSFFNTIFVFPGSLAKEEYSQVVAHEKCHIRLYHTCDKLFVHLIQVVFWFNPFIYLYRRSMDEVHEFEVDALLTKETDKKTYAFILLDLALQKNSSLVNNFSSEPLKTRIKMLFTRKSGKFKTVLYAAIIPVIALAMLSFNMRRGDQLNDKFISTIKDEKSVNSPATIPQKYQTIVNPSIEPIAVTDKKALDKRNDLKPYDGKINQPDRGTQDSLAQGDNITQTPGLPFLLRTTIKDEDGQEYDEVRLRFGKSYSLVGGVTKGGKILYMVGGKEYQEEEIKQFTQADVAGFSCPCSVQAIHKDKEPLISGIYEGIIRISNTN